MTTDSHGLPHVPPVLQRLWDQRRESIWDRVDRLVDGLRTAPAELDAAARADLTVTAHQLHGLLGTFGMRDGSELAGAAEALLGLGEPDSAATRLLADQLAALAAQLRGADSGQDDVAGP